MPLRTYHHKDGTEYLLGTGGSLILACPVCGAEHFREPSNYFGPEPWGNPTWHHCFHCPNVQMEPIRMDELESRWKPFWAWLIHLDDGKKSY